MVAALVGLCVDALARALLGEYESVDDTDVAALVERLELLPAQIGQRLAQRLQFYRLQSTPRRGHDMPTDGEYALWTAFVDHQWLTEVRVRAVPSWLLGSQAHWSALPLQILDCSRLDDTWSPRLSSFLGMSLSFRELRELNFSGQCEVVTDMVLETIADHGCALHVLDLSYCLHLGDSALEALILRQPSLRRLRLNGLRQITRPQVIAAIEACTELTELELEDCVVLTRLPDLPTRLLDLTNLNLHGMTQFNDHQTCVSLTKTSQQHSMAAWEVIAGESATRRYLRDGFRPASDVGDVENKLKRNSLVRLQLTELRLRCTGMRDPVLKAIGSVLIGLRLLDLEQATKSLYQSLVPVVFETRRRDESHFQWRRLFCQMERMYRRPQQSTESCLHLI